MEFVVFLAAVAVIGGLGIRIGMLVASRMSRWVERQDEEPSDRDE